jgi:hypothetical protein
VKTEEGRLAVKGFGKGLKDGMLRFLLGKLFFE